MMDPIDTDEGQGARWRRRRLFRQRKIPVRFLLPNLFTLLSLCAGVTAIRMGLEGRYEFAVGLVVAAALLDGVDGRLARALKAQSRFGAELDSLADFVNFGVAPAIVVFTWAYGITPVKFAWGFGSGRGFGWLAAVVFACGMALRLARFNAMLDVDKPKWQSNYFTGIPAPAGAIVVMLPLYLEGIGIGDFRHWPLIVSLYMMAIAGMLVSTVPTFSGKLMGERISREYVLPILVGAALIVGLLATYTSATLAVLTIAYLAAIPLSVKRYRQLMARWLAENPQAAAGGPAPAQTAAASAPQGGAASVSNPLLASIPPSETKH